jgi:hypothetical protein
MINKKIKIMAVVAIAIGIITVGLGGAVNASTNNGNGFNFMTGLASAIAQKFNLNVNDVQQVIDDQMVQKKVQVMADNQQTFLNRVNKAVADGKLTQDQANKIIAKKASIELEISALKGKTQDEIKNGIEKIHESTRQWMTDNNIPKQYFMVGFNGNLHKMNGRFGK